MKVEVSVPQVRTCSTQEDDALIALPVLDEWGWEVGPDSVVFHSLGGIRVKRTERSREWTPGGNARWKRVDPPVLTAAGTDLSGFRKVRGRKKTGRGKATVRTTEPPDLVSDSSGDEDGEFPKGVEPAKAEPKPTLMGTTGPAQARARGAVGWLLTERVGMLSR